MTSPQDITAEECKHCFEKTKNCKCVFATCQVCREKFPEDEMYEYRGFLSCDKDFLTLERKVNEKRARVMEIVEHSITSQRKGEFVNNRKKYHLGNVASDGLPIVKVEEPVIEEEYRNGIL